MIKMQFSKEVIVNLNSSRFTFWLTSDFFQFCSYIFDKYKEFLRKYVEE